MFWYILFLSRYLLPPMVLVTGCRLFFSVFVNFPIFVRNRIDIFVLRVALWPILENVHWTWEQGLCYWWNILYMFKSRVSLLIFCLDNLFIGESWLLKFPTIIVLLAVCPFRSVNSCFTHLMASILGKY